MEQWKLKLEMISNNVPACQEVMTSDDNAHHHRIVCENPQRRR